MILMHAMSCSETSVHAIDTFCSSSDAVEKNQEGNLWGLRESIVTLYLEQKSLS
jgi:hypothetical protein